MQWWLCWSKRFKAIGRVFVLLYGHHRVLVGGGAQWLAARIHRVPAVLKWAHSWILSCHHTTMVPVIIRQKRGGAVHWPQDSMD